MEKFVPAESVVVKFDDGGSASGKVIRPLGDDMYLVFYIWHGGWKAGKYHSRQLTSFGVAQFLVTEAFDASQSELAELANEC